MIPTVVPERGETPIEAHVRDLEVVQRLVQDGDPLGYARCYCFGALRARGVSRAEAERRVQKEIV
jgi:hypothetical protein